MLENQSDWIEEVLGYVLTYRAAERRGTRTWSESLSSVLGAAMWVPVDLYELEGLPLGEERLARQLEQIYLGGQLRQINHDYLLVFGTPGQIDEQEDLDRQAELLDASRFLAALETPGWVFSGSAGFGRRALYEPLHTRRGAKETALRGAGNLLVRFGWVARDGRCEEWREEVRAVEVNRSWSHRVARYRYLAEVHFRYVGRGVYR